MNKNMLINTREFSLAQMMEYTKNSPESDNVKYWADLLELPKKEISSISVYGDNDRNKELVFVGLQWIWNEEETDIIELRLFDKITPDDIGAVIMKIVIAVARFYQAPRIIIESRGRYVLKEYPLWKWYQSEEIGFKVSHNKSELIMELK